MAIIRKVAVHENSRMWAYIEYNDENPKATLKILGNKEFSTEQEARDYSKGFAIDSYEWVEPKELKQKRLTEEKERLMNRVEQINSELANL